MTKQEIIDYLYENHVQGDFKVEEMAEDLAQSEISYLDCSNAMLKMWMDNVVTDGEYNRIMDKLNKKHEEDMIGDSDDL